MMNWIKKNWVWMLVIFAGFLVRTTALKGAINKSIIHRKPVSVIS